MSASEMERLACEVCGRQDCATLGYGNPAHKREHHENLARHWRLGCERLTAKLRAANAESASLRERLRESEASVAQLVGDVQAVSLDYTQALEALRGERERHRVAEDDPFGTRLCHECDGHWPCSASLRLAAALSGSSAPQAAATPEDAEGGGR